MLCCKHDPGIPACGHDATGAQPVVCPWPGDRLTQGQFTMRRRAFTSSFLTLAFAVLLTASGCLASSEPFRSAAFPTPQAPLFSSPGFRSGPLLSDDAGGEFTLVAFERMVLEGGNQSDINIDLSRSPQPLERYLFVIDRSRHSVTVLNADAKDIPEDVGDIHVRLTLELTDPVALAGYRPPDETVFRFAVQYVPGFVRIVDVTTQTDAVLEITKLTKGTQSTLIQTSLAGLRATFAVDVLDLDRDDDENRLEEEVGPISREDKPQQPLNLGESSAGGTVNVVVRLSDQAPPVAVLPPPTEDITPPRQDDPPPKDVDQPPQPEPSQPPPDGDGQNDDNASAADDTPSDTETPQSSATPQPTDPEGEDTVPDSSGGDPTVANFDVVLIIDSSSSMLFDDPDDDRLEAARVFFNAALSDDRVGIVIFYDKIITTPLTRIVHRGGSRDSGEIRRLKQALDVEIDLKTGLTPSHLGITTACDELSAHGRLPRRAAILFSNGEVTSGASRSLVGFPEDCFVENGWAIYTVGVGNYNEKLLRQLADDTGGNFRGVNRDDGAFMICEVQAIRSDMAGGGATSCQVRLLSQGQTINFPINVPAAQRKATFTLNWVGSETDVELRLVRPPSAPSPRDVAGRVFLPNDIQVAYDRGVGKSLEAYGIGFPEAGAWEVSIIAKNVPPEGVEVVFGFSTVPAAR